MFPAFYDMSLALGVYHANYHIKYYSTRMKYVDFARTCHPGWPLTRDGKIHVDAADMESIEVDHKAGVYWVVHCRSGINFTRTTISRKSFILG